jgi:hypothetical protein
MVTNAAKKSAEPANDPSTSSRTLKAIGGSKNDAWNSILVNQALSTLWLAHSKDETQKRQYSGTLAALVSIGPKDELEGMIAAQLLACHNAAMEWHRRAMIGEQTFEGRQENLNQANKLSRTFATLLETLNRHRGKGGQQKVIVEHVNVAAGGQAIVGNVASPGGGDQRKSEDQPHAKLAYAPGTTMPSADTTREPVPVAGNAERSMPDARWNVTGRTEGK